jgi:serine/threonine protein kinase
LVFRLAGARVTTSNPTVEMYWWTPASRSGRYSKGDELENGSMRCRYAMKTLEKEEMLERNKVMRVLTEEQILQAVDHPFLASLAGTIETPTHLHFLMEFCEGGELYAMLTGKPMKRLKESHMRFYCAEVPQLFRFQPHTYIARRDHAILSHHSFSRAVMR